MQAGEVVEVTSHRKPIARITAVRQTEPVSTNPLQKAIDIGIVSLEWTEAQPAAARQIARQGEAHE